MRNLASKIRILLTISFVLGCLFLLTSCYIGDTHIHQYEHITVAPTCTEGGYQKNICSCGYSFETKHTEALGHTEVLDPGVAPTCSEEGLTDGTKCSVCDTPLKAKETIGVIPHNYSEEYSADENGHFLLCECGAESNRQVHTSNAPATVTEPEICEACSHVMLEPTGVTFPGFDVQGTEASQTVNTTTVEFSFTLALTIVGNTEFTVYSDASCTNAIQPVVSLAEGENVFYVKEEHAGAVNIYKIVIYRLHLYTVEFVVGGGYPSLFVTVEEGSTVTPPTVSREGFEFLGWNYDFTTPITADTTITSEWRDKKDTKYTITYYIQNIHDDGYSVYTSQIFYEEKGATIETTPIAIDHCHFNAALSILSDIVKADGSSELKLYYDREVYTLSLRDAQSGTVVGLGSYRYGATITVEASTFMGYRFLGWYTGDTLVTNLERVYFDIDCDMEARYEMTQEMLDFNFESTEDSCVITGTTATGGTITLPSCATAIAPGAFKDMTNLEVIYIPSSVTSIGANAFSGIRAEIIFIVGVQLKTIGTGAFSGYLGDVITIPASVTTIESGAFSNCASEIRWGSGSAVTTLGEGAFSGYKGETLTLPPRLTNIKENAFEGCIFIKIFFLGTAEEWANITVSSGNTILLQIQIYIYSDFNPEREGNYWYYGEDGIEIYPTHVHTEETVRGYAPTCTENGLTDGSHCSVCGKVFSTQETIPALGHTEVIYPGYAATCAYTGRSDGKICTTCGVETVARTVISALSHTSTTTYCNVCGHAPATSNSYFTFTYNSAQGGYLISANAQTLPNTLVLPTTANDGRRVVGIADNGFMGHTEIRFVEIPSGYKYIGASAFNGCTQLQNIYLPSTVTTIGQNAFKNLYSIGYANLYLEHDAPLSSWSSSWNGSTAPLYGVRGLVRDSDRSIYVVMESGELLFVTCNNTSGTTYTIPESVMSLPVTHIASYAFTFDSTHRMIYVPTTVKTIWSYAFKNANKVIRGISIPSTVETIANAAVELSYLNPFVVTDAPSRPSGWHQNFANAWYTYYGVESVAMETDYTYALTSDGAIILERHNRIASGTLTIPETLGGKPVVRIGYRAFDGIYASAVVLPNSLIEIDRYAFQYADIRTITWGENLTTIGAYAFQNCDELTEINLPSSIVTIGENAFYGCINVSKAVIPSTITKIPASFFTNMTLLTEVTLFEGLVEIGDYAFNNCTSLVTIQIPSTVTNIGAGAFSGCTALTEIVIPNGVTTLGSNVFSGCSKLANITLSTGLTSIGTGAFMNTALIEITLPNGITEIPDKAFKGCTALTNVTLPASLEKIGTYAFDGCTSLKNVRLPASLSVIGQYAYTGCTSLLTVLIPSSVETVGVGAFNATYTTIATPATEIPFGWELYNNVLSNITDIGVYDDTFIYIIKDNRATIVKCVKNVASVEIPESINNAPVTTIEKNAFKGNTVLRALTLPSSLEEIGDNAFYNCTNLSYILFKGENLTVGENAFQNIFATPTLLFKESVAPEAITALFAEDVLVYTSIEEIVYDSTYVYARIADGYMVLYYQGEHIGELAFPSSYNGIPFVAIGKNAFVGKINMLLLPSNITKIMPGAFSNGNVKSVYFYTSQSAVEIDESLYPNVLFAYGISEMLTSEDGFCYRIDENGHAYLRGYQGEATEIVIPYAIGIYTVRDFSSVLSNNSTVTKVTISAAVNKISPYAFYNCSALKSVRFDNSNIKGLDDYAFYNCKAIQGFPVYALTYFGHYSLYGCNNSQNYMTVPNKAVFIGDYAFARCYLNNTITLDNYSIQYIGTYAFENATIYEVIIRGSNTVIADYAFYSFSIEDLELYGIDTVGKYAFAHNRITSLSLDCRLIDESAFQGNSKLESISITAKSIGHNAFNGCSKLTSVFLSSSVEEMGAYVFRNCLNLTTIRLGHKEIPSAWNTYWNGSAATIQYNKYS